MAAVNWTRNVSFIDEANDDIAGIGDRADWLAFLDALGRVEGQNDYNAINQLGYVGIYQYSPTTAAFPMRTTLEFANNIGAMTGVASDEEFRANPIAQELAALMEFSGTAPVANGFPSMNGVGPTQPIDMTIYSNEFSASEALRSPILVPKTTL